MTKTTKCFPLIFFCCIFCSFMEKSSAGDVLRANQPLKGEDTIVSADGEFELGFFSPGSSKNRYLSIRYKRAGEVIVWVANRDVPLTNASGELTLSSTGTLEIFNGTNNSIWSTSSSKTIRNPVAQLLNSGNLVIRTFDDPDIENFHWQSFDYPDSTLLPGMKLGKNLANGRDWSFSSWKSNDDPSPGNFQVKLDVTGYPQLFIWNNSTRHFRSGPWNGVRLNGVPTSGPNDIFVSKFIFNEEEIYYQFVLVSSSVLMRVTTEPDGQVKRYTWTNQSSTWAPSINLQTDYCDGYALCGEYASCNIDSSSRCKCLDGFQPKNPNAWSNLIFTEGCVPEKKLNCSDKHVFMKQSNKKLPDTQNSQYNFSLNLKDCEKKCLENCSCTAYANTNITGKGSGCLLWFSGLIDIRDQERSEQDFHVRVAASGSGANSSSRARRIALIVSLPVILILTAVLGCYMWHVCKHRKKIAEGEMIEIEVDYEKEDLPFFDFRTIADATNNFSYNCKIGEGGFGPVYKGILEDGKEIAVKRRSACSTQGVEEFRNEVSCIAKLQHRNLVRLLGWPTTEEGERMLVYEYMPNKSLDYFIFGDNETRASLNWPKRYNIINGIVKGLLYLHEDSRLRVIHRDLKASNILLDYHMNPKISDFGMARSFGDSETISNTARVVGTYGYMSPEYAIDGSFSIKSDVYSFGVLVIEIVSGKRNRFFSHSDHNLNLMGHAWMCYKEDRLSELIDASIMESSDHDEAFRVILIGLLCVQQYPEDRPNMSSVLMMLTSKVTLPQPKQPGFFTERKHDEADTFGTILDLSSSNQTVTTVAPR
ncbi:hypothetical protein AgCh_023442 [Apium graveolens]